MKIYYSISLVEKTSKDGKKYYVLRLQATDNKSLLED